jgi:hypothetical protein
MFLIDFSFKSYRMGPKFDKFYYILFIYSYKASGIFYSFIYSINNYFLLYFIWCTILRTCMAVLDFSAPPTPRTDRPGP